jgi:LysW-gamma-L-lysine carboxypeptidase
MSANQPLFDPIQMLTGLVQHYSPSGQEATAVQFLVQQMQTAGFDAYCDAVGNAVGTLGTGPLRVMMLGHIDTVPGEIPVQVTDGKLYGRGSVDAKGPLATFVSAAAQGPIEGLQLMVVGAVGEEADSGGAAYLKANTLAGHTPVPDFLIIGEPSHWQRLTLGYKGSAWFNIQVRRPNAHTASRHASACEVAVEIWQSIADWARQHNTDISSEFGKLVPTLQAIHSQNDGLYGTAELQINFRLPPGWETDQLRAAVEQRLPADTQLRMNADAVPAFRSDKNNALVRAGLRAIRAHGGKPEFVLKTGTSDMNMVAPVWQCPTVAYGPGDSNLDHTPEEHIELAEYQQAVRVLRSWLEMLAPPPEHSAD